MIIQKMINNLSNKVTVKNSKNKKPFFQRIPSLSAEPSDHDKCLILGGVEKKASDKYKCKLTEKDLLKEGLNGKLELSVLLPRETGAIKVKIFHNDFRLAIRSFSTTTISEIIPQSEQFMSDISENEKEFYQLDDEIVMLEGIVDLHMVGAGKLSVANRLKNLIDGGTINCENPVGVLVEKDGITYQIQKLSDDGRYYPVENILEHGILVIRASELEEWESELIGREESNSRAVQGKAAENVQCLNGGFIAMLKGDTEDIVKHLPFKNDEAIKVYIEDNLNIVKKRTLDKIFKKSNSMFEDSKTK